MQISSNTKNKITTDNLTPYETHLLARIIECIHINIQQKNIVALLVESFKMNGNTIHNKIKELSGLTPVKFINNIKLENAAIIINKYNRISTVAKLSGFPSEAYMSKKFKEKYGMSPLQYRTIIRLAENITN